MDIRKFVEQVVLVGYILCFGAGDQCKAAKGPILCYDCSTLDGDNFCGDPFNDSHPDMRTISCDSQNGELCAKWVRKKTEDDVNVDVIRTCSSKLNLELYITSVCMDESRPGSGHLCFCEKDICNGASGLGKSTTTTTLLAVVLACVCKHAMFAHYSWRNSVTSVLLLAIIHACTNSWIS